MVGITRSKVIFTALKNQNGLLKKPTGRDIALSETLVTTRTTTTTTWKAGRLVCRAPRLLRFGGCRCTAEGPGRHPLADLGRDGPVAVAHHGCSVWRSSNVFRQHQVFEIPVKRFDIGHLQFDERERIVDYKSSTCRIIDAGEICWSCPGWKRVLGHVVCNSQLAPEQLQRSLGEGGISINFEFIVWAEFKGMQKRSVLSVFVHETHTHSTVIWLIGSKFDEVAGFWLTGRLHSAGVLGSKWYQFSSLGIVRGLGWSSCHGQKLQIIQKNAIKCLKCKPHCDWKDFCSFMTLCSRFRGVYTKHFRYLKLRYSPI